MLDFQKFIKIHFKDSLKWLSIAFSPQDAHELFHVLTSSLEEERERKPRVAHLFDMQTLEVNMNSHR